MITLYNLGYTVKQISEKLQCDPTTVAKVLKANGITPRNSLFKRIDQFDMANNYIQTFLSTNEAAEWLIDSGINGLIKTMRSAINKCCRNERKSAYNYKWKLAPELE